MGQDLSHTEGSTWLEGEAAEGRYRLGVFCFYNEYAPYSKAAIARMVAKERASAKE